ncbi:MAG: hypothetical protein AAF789_08010 [Bacteroidota bacterium]
MESTTKKAIMLLKSLIFHYHGLDDEERELLLKAAEQIDGVPEMEWANAYIASDYISAFERSREFLKRVFMEMPSTKRLQYLLESWEENHVKGYVTEMETTALFTIAEDWKIDSEFLEKVKT